MQQYNKYTQNCATVLCIHFIIVYIYLFKTLDVVAKLIQYYDHCHVGTTVTCDDQYKEGSKLCVHLFLNITLCELNVLLTMRERLIHENNMQYHNVGPIQYDR